jgi:glycosyltransferase involved in cell wall biosynthesis
MTLPPQQPLRVSVVVPVYRSADILEELCRQLSDALNHAGWKDQYELILVNDCSPDDSWKVVRDLAARHPWVKGLSLRKNFGQHNALMAGLHHARGSIVVLMDDDLQHPPADVVRLVRALENNPTVDVCYTPGSDWAASSTIGWQPRC